MFVSVFQIACFPLKDIEPNESAELVYSARLLLSQFEAIVHDVLQQKFNHSMAYNFRTRLQRFFESFTRSISVDVTFLRKVLYSWDEEKRNADDTKIAQIENSIDIYLGGVGPNPFIFGI